MNPCPKTKSTTAFIPILKILFASLNALSIVIFLSGKSKSLSFGMITKLSTFCLKSSIPLSEFLLLFSPSKLKGLVTTATVRTSNSFATFAITGAAPVPVPPPIPAVINSISVPFKSS